MFVFERIRTQYIFILLIQSLNMLLTSRDFYIIIVQSNFELRNNWSNFSFSDFLSVHSTHIHQLHTGSSVLLLAVTYSITSTGCDSFKSWNDNYCSVRSLQSNINSYPAIIQWLCWFSLIIIYWSHLGTAYLYVQCVIMSVTIIICLPNWLAFQ